MSLNSRKLKQCTTIFVLTAGGVHTVCCVITTGDDTVLVQGVSILCVVLHYWV